MSKRARFSLCLVAALFFGSCGEGATPDSTASGGTGDTAQPSPSDTVTTEGTTQPDDSDEPADLGLLRIAYLGQFLPNFNLYVAEQGGFFEREGLEVESVPVQSFDLASQAVESGDADIGARNYDGILQAIAQGFEWKLLYPNVLYSSDAPDAKLMIRSDLFAGSPEEAVKALEGQPVAALPGSQAEMSVKAYLEHEWSFDPATLEIVSIRYPDLLAAFDTGTIAAAHVVEPFVAQIEEAGVAKSLAPHLDIVALLPPLGNGTRRFLISASFARADWIEENTEKVGAFVRAMDSATRAILDDPESFSDLATAYTGLPPDVAARMYPQHYVIDTSLSRDEVGALIHFSSEVGLIDQELALEDVVDAAFPLE